MTARWLAALSALALTAALLRADGARDNVADKVRPVPPPGVEISAADRAELQTGVNDLGKEIDDLRTALKDKPALLDLLPDVQIYHNAVRYALTYNEFYDVKQTTTAKALLKQGHERAEALRDGKAPWTTAAGLVARGYVSRIDGSVQPYGLVVPASFKPDAADKHRLDLWCHGRGENLSELNFIDGCQKGGAEFTPAGAFVLRLYGRYCCANKFAGEIDAFEAMDSVKKHYPIDDNRVVVRGFSMGGAACWHLAMHYPSVWAAAAPGAGFSETADFLKVFQNEAVKPTWYEQKLYHMYDATDYAGNLFNCPTVAYSGADDTQKQAADMMEAAAKREGLTLAYLIGPHTKHAYEPETKKELIKQIDALAEKGRDETPTKVSFTTYTLRYNRDAWVTVDGLGKHWERANVVATLALTGITADTKNVTALTLSLPVGQCPFEKAEKAKVTLDGTEIEAGPVGANGAWVAHFRKEADKWKRVDSADDGALAKRPGLQGPIDDAFMDSFVMVKPTGKPMNEKVGAWVDQEMKHAVDHWRKQFRGEARVKDDDAVTDGVFHFLSCAPTFSTGIGCLHEASIGPQASAIDPVDDGSLAKRHGLQGPIDDAFMDSFVMVKPTGKPMNEKVGAWVDQEMTHAVDHWRKQFRGEARVVADDAVTDADMASSNLVLWGDPSSNKVLAKIADKLPIRWDGDKIVVGAESYPAADHVPLLIYPNPLNPKKYVVLNSGFTFREYDYLNNARQISKLPDYAVIDVGTPPSPRLPGAVAAAGFFDEHWKLQPDGGK